MSLKRFLFVVGSVFILSTAAQAQEGATGVSMVENAPSSLSGAWGMSFFSLAVAPSNQISEGASVFSYNYLALNYKFSKTRRISFRPVFQYTTPGKDNLGKDAKDGMVMGDAHFVYADYEIATLGLANVSTSFKFYAPTSDASQSKGMIMKFRPETYIELGVGRYDSILYGMKPDFYVQSRASNFDNRNFEYTTKVFELEHWVEYDWSLSKTFTIAPAAGFIDTWSNPSKNPKVPTRQTQAKLALGLDIYATRGLNFTLSAENTFNVADRRDDVAVGRPEETSIVLVTNAAL